MFVLKSPKCPDHVIFSYLTVLPTGLIPFLKVLHVTRRGWKAIPIHRQMLLYYGLAEAGQWGWSIFPLHFPGPTARLRLRLINHLAPALLLCFLFKCRIDGFFLHFIDLCIMVLSLLLPLGRSPAPQTCLPRQRQAAWALCCLLFSLEKLMCCEISIYLTADTVMEAIRVQGRRSARGSGEVRDNPQAAGAQRRVAQPASQITQSPPSGRKH